MAKPTAPVSSLPGRVENFPSQLEEAQTFRWVVERLSELWRHLRRVRNFSKWPISSPLELGSSDKLFLCRETAYFPPLGPREQSRCHRPIFGGVPPLSPAYPSLSPHLLHGDGTSSTRRIQRSHRLSSRCRTKRVAFWMARLNFVTSLHVTLWGLRWLRWHDHVPYGWHGTFPLWEVKLDVVELFSIENCIAPAMHRAMPLDFDGWLRWHRWCYLGPKWQT